MSMLDRYASAIYSNSLKSSTKHDWADSDVLAAAGIASRQEPLGIELARLLSGGSGKTRVTDTMAYQLWRQAGKDRVKMSKVQALEVAKIVLAWHQFGVCPHCHGTGHRIVPGTPKLGDVCHQCSGTGKRSLERSVRREFVTLARWMANKIESRQHVAAGFAAHVIC